MLYKFFPLLLNLQPARFYHLEINIKELQFLQNVATDVSFVFIVNLSFNSLETRLIRAEGKLHSIESNSFLVPYPLYHLYHLFKTKDLLPYFIPIYFEIQNDNNFLIANLKNDYVKIDIENRNRYFSVQAMLLEYNTILCKAAYDNTFLSGGCSLNITNVKINDITISNMFGRIVGKWEHNNFNFTLSNTHFNLSYNNINIQQPNKRCRINGTFSKKNRQVKFNFSRKCSLNLNSIKLSPKKINILYENNKYTLALSVYNLRIEDNQILVKFKDMTISCDIVFLPRAIELEFDIKTSVSKLLVNSLQLLLPYRNIVRKPISISLSGKARINRESKSIELSKLAGNIGDTNIQDGVVIITNEYEIPFVELSINYLLLIDNNIRILKNIDIDDFICEINIKTLRKTAQNIEIGGDFKRCSLFFYELAQMHNSGGFWKILFDKELKNFEITMTTNSGAVAIPIKQYELSTNNIITLNINGKRTLNLLEIDINLSFIPQNDHLLSTWYIFFQRRNNRLLLDGQGKITSNIKSNHYLSKFSFTTNYDIEKKIFTIEHLKNIYNARIKNLNQFKNSFEEFFDFVNLDGYLSIGGNFEIKNNKLNSLNTTFFFLSPKFTLDRIKLDRIKIKIPIHIRDNIAITKGYIKLLSSEPFKMRAGIRIDKAVLPCINVKNIYIKNSAFELVSKKFTICMDVSNQKIRNIYIPLDNLSINPHTFKKNIRPLISKITLNKGGCEVKANQVEFKCSILLNIFSDYFPVSRIHTNLNAQFSTKLSTKYLVNGNLRDIQMERILEKIGFQKSLTGLYNLDLSRLQIENGKIKEIEGIITSKDDSEKKIFEEFFVMLVKNLLNMKIGARKGVKKFNTLGIYFRYIKGKLIIKSLYYKKGKDLLVYDRRDFNTRETFLKSKGEKDCFIVGRGVNVLNLCSKGAVIISVDKILKLKNILFKK
ncbi:MAG: hypothetical protein ACK4NF_00285 [Planctomycetota bacterium]